MPIKEFKGYEEPHYDGRVKQIMQIENILAILKHGAIIFGLSLLFGMFFIGFTKAQSVPDLFYVPVVTLTPGGAAVTQPQTGEGVRISPRESVNQFQSGTYRPPQYDSFREGSADQSIALPDLPVRNLTTVDFTIKNNIQGASDQSFGTTQTTFIFTAITGNGGTGRAGLEYRWDFQNDGKIDSFFSKINTISHIYRNPGEYEVRLDVLDNNGNISTAIKRVTIVENTPPIAIFKVDKLTAPKNSIFRFDTSLSNDSQYSKSTLMYRFDWDSDGVFDTAYQKKTVWNHLFRDTGSYTVTMEVIDPEGLTAKAEIDLQVLDDSPPSASFSVERLSDYRYQFDASSSADDHTPLKSLKFRWDFNYTGRDDIVLDTSWSSSPRFTGNYRLGGSKTIRLQVMDQQGLIDESFAQISVPWTEDYLNLAISLV